MKNKGTDIFKFTRFRTDQLSWLVNVKVPSRAVGVRAGEFIGTVTKTAKGNYRAELPGGAANIQNDRNTREDAATALLSLYKNSKQ